MFRSLDILRNISGHEEREQTYNELKETLLEDIRPRVRRDILNNDISPLVEYLYVYEKLGSRQEFEDEFIKSRCQEIFKFWGKYETNQENTNTNTNTNLKFLNFYNNFLNYIINFIENEIIIIITIFGKENNNNNLLINSIIILIFNQISNELLNNLILLKSPQIVYETYELTELFLMKIFHNLETKTIPQIILILKTIFNSYELYLNNNYIEIENNNLKNDLQNIINNITFIKIKSNNNNSMNNSIENSFEDINDVSLDFLGDIEEDPYDIINKFSEKLINAAEKSIIPIQKCIKRSVLFLGGICSKLIIRSTSTIFSNFIKLLYKKIDELRIACGIPSERSIAMFKSVNETTINGINQLNITNDEKNNNEIAENWYKKLEMIDIGNKPSIVCALHSLQAVGRLIKQINSIELITKNMLLLLLNNNYRELSLEKSIYNIINNIINNNNTINNTNNNKLGSAYASVILHQDYNLSSELRNFLLTSTSTSNSNQISNNTIIFTNLNISLLNCKSSSGSMLYDLCTILPEKVLTELYSEHIWYHTPNEYETVDNLLPQTFFTQVSDLI